MKGKWHWSLVQIGRELKSKQNKNGTKTFCRVGYIEITIFYGKPISIVS